MDFVRPDFDIAALQKHVATHLPNMPATCPDCGGAVMVAPVMFRLVPTTEQETDTGCNVVVWMCQDCGMMRLMSARMAGLDETPGPLGLVP